jgi:hypothetical protein
MSKKVEYPDQEQLILTADPIIKLDGLFLMKLNKLDKFIE